ncbi:hypothetical protein HMPREF3289_14825 [Pseudomonas sp. HMSC75E02]|nr:hypothetical protein HMPREF3289_14825 [Pseudomonas sp. HMSC75E02]
MLEMVDYHRRFEVPIRLVEGPELRELEPALNARATCAVELPGVSRTLDPYAPSRRLFERFLRLPQVFYNFGHGHIGLTLGAITGQLLAEQASGLAPSVSLEPFLARRFAG